jgi:hypothetical protein
MWCASLDRVGGRVHRRSNVLGRLVFQAFDDCVEQALPVVELVVERTTGQTGCAHQPDVISPSRVALVPSTPVVLPG